MTISSGPIDVTSLRGRHETHRWNRVSVGDLCEQLVWSRPDKETVVGHEGAYAYPEHRRLTYREVDELANRVANALAAQGLHANTFLRTAPDVVPANGQTVAESEVIEFCRSRLAGFETPKRVTVTDALPETVGQVPDPGRRQTPVHRMTTRTVACGHKERAGSRRNHVSCARTSPRFSAACFRLGVNN